MEQSVLQVKLLQISVIMPFLVYVTGTKKKHSCIKKNTLKIVSILTAMFNT